MCIFSVFRHNIVRAGSVVKPKMDKRNNGKNDRLPALVLISLVILLISSCATMQQAYHEYVMRGSIVETSDSDVR